MKSVVLTGAAGGVGRAMLSMLAQNGYVTYAGAMCDWEMSELEHMRAALPPHLVVPVWLDVREPEHVEALGKRLAADHAELRALICNGGVCPVGIPFEHVDLDTTRDAFETNVVGNMRLAQMGLPFLRKTRGRIINVSSLWGITTGPLQMSYTVSKHGLEAYSQLLRRELWNDGIKVVVINPGVIRRTYMIASTYEAAKQTIAKIKGVPPQTISPRSHDVGQNDKLRNPTPVADPRYLADYNEVFQILAHSLDSSKLNHVISTPERVAKVMLRALHSRSPRARYTVGWDARVVSALFKMLPTGIYNALLRQARPSA